MLHIIALLGHAVVVGGNLGGSAAEGGGEDSVAQNVSEARGAISRSQVEVRDPGLLQVRHAMSETAPPQRSDG